MIPIDFGVSRSKVKVTITWSIIKHRDTIYNWCLSWPWLTYDPYIDVRVSRAEVKVTVTWSIKSLSAYNNLKPIVLRDTIVGVLVGHCP